MRGLTDKQTDGDMNKETEVKTDKEKFTKINTQRDNSPKSPPETTIKRACEQEAQKDEIK